VETDAFTYEQELFTIESKLKNCAS